MKAFAPARTRRTARGLAALEAVLLSVIVSAGLLLLAGQAETMRTQLRNDLASRQLALLREAVLVYYLDQGSFPPGRSDLAAMDAWRTLRSIRPAAKVLAAWPASPDAAGAREPVDPWREPYRYLSFGNDRSGRAIDNGTWPVFVSSGSDRSFGDISDAPAEVDNRGSDELLAAGPS